MGFPVLSFRIKYKEIQSTRLGLAASSALSAYTVPKYLCDCLQLIHNLTTGWLQQGYNDPQVAFAPRRIMVVYLQTKIFLRK